MLIYQTLFEEQGQFYLETKGMTYDIWLEAVTDGRKGDILTLYGSSVLTDVHTYVHLHKAEFWTTLKNIPKMHNEIMEQCDVHLLYLGRGLYIELTKCATPLEIIDNPGPSIKSVVIGELTTVEAGAYEAVLNTGLGTGINRSTVMKQANIKN